MKACLGLMGTLTLLLGFGCTASWFPGAWKTYEHPTYRFSIRTPSSWEKIENTPFGAAVLFRAPDNGQLFRTTVNVWVEELKDPEMTLDRLAELSEKQLFILLREYSILSKSPLKIGPVPAREIRGKYFGSEGERRIRTILMIHKGLQFIVTLSTSALEEANIQKTLNEILDSFRLETD